jgi:WD40 repeat protein
LFHLIRILGHLKEVTNIEFVGDHFLLSMDNGGVSKIWDIRDGTLIRTPKKMSPPAVKVQVIDSSVFILTSTGVQLRDVDTFSVMTTYQYSDLKDFYGLAVLDNLVYASTYSRVCSWLIETAGFQQLYVDPMDDQFKAGIPTVAVSENFVFLSSKSNITQFSRNTGAYVKVLDGHSYHVISLVVIDKVLYSGGWGTELINWDIESGSILRKMGNFCYSRLNYMLGTFLGIEAIYYHSEYNNVYFGFGPLLYSVKHNTSNNSVQTFACPDDRIQAIGVEPGALYYGSNNQVFKTFWRSEEPSMVFASNSCQF